MDGLVQEKRSPFWDILTFMLHIHESIQEEAHGCD